MRRSKSTNISKKAPSFPTKTSRLTLTLALASILVISLGLYAYRLIPLPAPIGINEVRNSAGYISLSFSPTSLTGTKDVESSLTLIANTGDARLTALDAELTYDPTMISQPTVTIGDFLPNIFASPVVNNGSIKFAFAASPDSGGSNGTGNIATIKFKPLKDGSSKISFSTNIIATGLNSAKEPLLGNILRSVEDATIAVGSAAAASPSPTNTASPTTTLSPSPSTASNTVSVVTTTTTTTTPKKTTAPKVSTTTPTAPAPTSPSTDSSSSQNTYIDPDNFLSPAPSPDLSSSKTSKTGILRQIFLGWSIIFQSIFDFLFG